MCDNSRECAADKRHGFGESRDGREVTNGERPAGQEGAQPAEVHPQRSLVGKLGIRVGMRVFAAAGLDRAVEAVVRAAGADVTSGPGAPAADTQAVLLQVADRSRLAEIPALRDALARDGMLWVVWPKGREEVRESDVQQAGLVAGLVDVKVASISEKLSGLKFVFRLRDR